MKHSVFDKAKIIRGLFSHPGVRFRPYDFARESDEAAIHVKIGAFCNISLAFSKVPGTPEWCQAMIGKHSYVFVAGEVDEAEVAERLWTSARSMLFASAVLEEDPCERLPEGLDVFDEIPSEWEAVAAVEAAVHDNLEYPFAKLGSAADMPGHGNKKRFFFEDVSWDDEEPLRGRCIRECVIALLDSWDVLFPDFRIVGCDADEFRFVHNGCRGYVFIDRAFSEEDMVEIDVHLQSGPYDASGCSIPPFRENMDGAAEKVAQWLQAAAPAFKNSCRSLTSRPIIVDETMAECNYSPGEVPYATRSLYPASTAAEIRAALSRAGIPRPVELARLLVGGGELSGYSQSSYDDQHDYEVVSKCFSYDDAAGILEFSQAVNECVNMPNFPDFREGFSYRFSNLSVHRLERVATLEEEPLDFEPHFAEWTLWTQSDEDGNFTYQVGEFPELKITAKDSYAGYNAICEAIDERIDELMASGEPVPRPFSWRKTEEYMERMQKGMEADA